MKMMNTLFDIAGVRARIFHLPNRPAFMIGNDLAEVYGSSPKRINEAVSRNPDRFPEDFAFELTEAEMQVLVTQNAASKSSNWSQFATSWARKGADWRPVVFTHAGAMMLSALLRSETAVAMSIVIHRAFAAMEARALADANHMLMKLQSEVRGKRGLRSRVVDASREGWTYQQLAQDVSHSRAKVIAEIAICLAMELIPAPLKGTPADTLPLFT
jgi:ORF6N domain